MIDFSALHFNADDRGFQWSTSKDSLNGAIYGIRSYTRRSIRLVDFTTGSEDPEILFENLDARQYLDSILIIVKDIYV